MTPKVRALIEQTKWDEFDTVRGSAEAIPQAIESLVCASDDAQAEVAYWRLDNVVVVQGAVLSAAIPVIGVLIETLKGPIPDFVRSRLLDLLFELQGDDLHEDEIIRGNLSVAVECTTAVRLGLPEYRAATESPDPSVRRAAIDLVGQLETAPIVRSRILNIARTDRIESIRKSAIWWLSNPPTDT